MPSPTPTGTSRHRPWTIVVSALAVAVLILLVGIFAYQGGASQGASGSGAAPQGSAGSESTPLDMSRRTADDPTALGPVDAPVVLVEYADYRCPFCGLFSRDTLPPLVKKYVKSGDLRVEWRDLPVFGDQSTMAAVAGRAAGNQGKFWEFNKAAFAIAPERGHADLSRERLVQIAKESGVPDLTQFEADLDSEELQQAVAKDAQEAASLGATGTPTFLVNETPLIGAQPLATFEKAIDAALKKAESQ
ncbi:thioredoxin domain-containing protein [Arthrobacter sp. KFRI-F3372]|uniref:DsbA family protein n=2 Tax=Micrococcales TaxID=85006 RepID=UPI002784CD9D|nr:MULTISPECIES: thioredoxin domain-containing protein [Micrococcaceae]MDP9988364.1 protein-disulfide isomerase [Arthrobacter oryzae]MEE2523862.1 thioredoxin domain-containing protein [Pseudarthrobacter sp. J47]WHP61032.1 thioredoxin domain-containing protein [Arthrobacter sp. KFRI-F3372]